MRLLGMALRLGPVFHQLSGLGSAGRGCRRDLRTAPFRGRPPATTGRPAPQRRPSSCRAAPRLGAGRGRGVRRGHRPCRQEARSALAERSTGHASSWCWRGACALPRQRQPGLAARPALRGRVSSSPHFLGDPGSQSPVHGLHQARQGSEGPVGPWARTLSLCRLLHVRGHGRRMKWTAAGLPRAKAPMLSEVVFFSYSKRLRQPKSGILSHEPRGQPMRLTYTTLTQKHTPVLTHTGSQARAHTHSLARSRVCLWMYRYRACCACCMCRVCCG